MYALKYQSSEEAFSFSMSKIIRMQNVNIFKHLHASEASFFTLLHPYCNFPYSEEIINDYEAERN